MEKVILFNVFCLCLQLFKKSAWDLQNAHMRIWSERGGVGFIRVPVSVDVTLINIKGRILLREVFVSCNYTALPVNQMNRSCKDLSPWYIQIILTLNPACWRICPLLEVHLQLLFYFLFFSTHSNWTFNAHVILQTTPCFVYCILFFRLSLFFAF